MNSKYIHAILVSVVSLTVFALAATFASARLCGDVDGDGITADDARSALRCAVGLDEVTPEVYDILDVNGDLTVTAADAREILRMAVMLTETKHYFAPEVIKAATCREAGKQLRKCTECTECKSFEQTVPALGHDFVSGEHEIIKAATCTETGLEKVTCVRGDKTEEWIIPITHDYTQATCTESAVCKICGSTGEKALGHTTKLGTCGRCGKFLNDIPEDTAALVTAVRDARKKVDAAYAKLNEIPNFDIREEKQAVYAQTRALYIDAMNAYINAYNLTVKHTEFRKAGNAASACYKTIAEIVAEDKAVLNINNEWTILLAIDALQAKLDGYNKTLDEIIKGWGM